MAHGVDSLALLSGKFPPFPSPSPFSFAQREIIGEDDDFREWEWEEN